jgi:hypothetical protein
MKINLNEEVRKTIEHMEKLDDRTETIHMTLEHKRFSFLDENRPIDEQHYKKLMKTILEDNQCDSHPIEVKRSNDGSKLEIYDGQHRFAVCRDLGFPIYYKFTTRTFDQVIRESTTHRPWSFQNFLHKFVIQGKPEYIFLNEMSKKLKFISVNTLINFSLVSKQANAYQRFKDGGTIIHNKKRFEETLMVTDEIIEKFVEKMLYKKDQVLIRNSHFILSLLKFLMNESVDQKYFKNKILEYFDKLRRCSGEAEYIKMFFDIYNFKRQTGRLQHIKFISLKNLKNLEEEIKGKDE